MDVFWVDLRKRRMKNLM